MKKYMVFIGCCLAMAISAGNAFAQAGFTGPNGTPGNPGQFGFGFGFTGPSQTVTVAQANSFADKTPVIVSGNIVQAIGADRYTFRDSSGEITLRIGPKEWQNFGFNISPSDTIEISGEVHWDRKNFRAAPEIKAKQIRIVG